MWKLHCDKCDAIIDSAISFTDPALARGKNETGQGVFSVVLLYQTQQDPPLNLCPECMANLMERALQEGEVYSAV